MSIYIKIKANFPMSYFYIVGYWAEQTTRKLANRRTLTTSREDFLRHPDSTRRKVINSCWGLTRRRLCALPNPRVRRNSSYPDISPGWSSSYLLLTTISCRHLKSSTSAKMKGPLAISSSWTMHIKVYLWYGGSFVYIRPLKGMDHVDIIYSDSFCPDWN